MRTEQENELIKAIENNSLYDFIALNYWTLDNDLIISLLKETIYLIDETQNKQLIENLKEFQGIEKREEEQENEEN